MSEETTAASQFEHWARSVATVVAPATVLSAVLFYFGYVSSRAQYEYFGIDVDTVDLGTQDYIMRSPQPLLVPLLVLALVGIGVLALLAATRRWVAEAGVGGDGLRVPRVRLLARVCLAAGLTVLGAGVVLLPVYVQLRDWALYPPVTLVLVVIAVSVFWTTATVAQWSGRGLAKQQALNLDRLPSVILDTQDRMFLVPNNWSASNSTLVVSLDSSVRVQFQFQNEHP